MWEICPLPQGLNLFDSFDNLIISTLSVALAKSKGDNFREAVDFFLKWLFTVICLFIKQRMIYCLQFFALRKILAKSVNIRWVKV